MEEIRAVIQKIVRNGKHGPYAVVKANGIKGSLTFSLGGDVWQEETVPEPGTEIILSKLVKKQAGWRAMSGRLLKPSDEQ